jgi:hypothetical protein
MDIVQDFIPLGRGNRPAFAMVPKYITIHETGNTSAGAGAKMHANYIKGDAAASRPASWHFTVDSVSIYQHLPINESAWHAGDGHGDGNRKSIGIEMCVNSDGNYEQTLTNTIWLCKKLMAENNISELKQHFNWSGKNCPAKLRSLGRWNEFVDRVKGDGTMNVNDKVTIKSTATTYTTGEVIADRFKGVPYTIQALGTSTNGRLGSALIKELVSWVRLTDLQPVVVAPPATVLKSEYDIVIAQRDKLKIECDLLKDNIVRLKAEVTYLQGQVKTVSDTLAKEKATTMAQSAEMVHLNQQLATVKDSLAAEKIVLTALNAKYNKLDAEYVQLIRVDADNVKKIHDLNSQIELLLINNLNLEKEVEKLYTENISLKQQTYIDWQDATWKQLLKQAIIKWWNE